MSHHPAHAAGTPAVADDRLAPTAAAYIALILAPERNHTVRVDLTAHDLSDAREQARRRGAALFRQGGFTFCVRPA